MKLSQAIRNWQKSGTYAEGLAIYHKVKINQQYDKFLNGNYELKSNQGIVLKTQLSTALSKLLSNPSHDIEYITAGATQQQTHQITQAPKANPLLNKQQTSNNNGEALTSHASKQQTTIDASANNKHQTSTAQPSRPEGVNNIDAPANKVRIVDNELIDLSALPPEMQSLFKTIKSTFPSLAYAHEQMRNAANDSERKLHLTEAIKYNSQIRDLWYQIDTFAIQNPEVIKPGAIEKLKANIAAIESDLGKIDPVPNHGEASTDFAKLQNLTRNLQRHKKDLKEKQLSARKRADKEAVVKKIEQDISKLKTKLGVADGK